MNRRMIAIAGLLAALGMPARADGPPPGGVIKADGARAELGTNPEVQGPGEVHVRYKNLALNLRGRATNIVEEFLAPVDSPELQKLAQAFGARLEWQESTQTMRCLRGTEVRTLKLGEARVQSSVEKQGPERADLAFPIQEVDGKVMISLSALEEFLDVRMTFRENGLVWMEPLIANVRLDGLGSKPRLVIESSAPVTYKTFTLHAPERYVIDVYGAVLNTPGMSVGNPIIGNIRLGQFELGPARSRIVIPTASGVEVIGPHAGRGDAISFQLGLAHAHAVPTGAPLERISQVNFEHKDNGGYKLSIVAGGPLQYQWQRLADGRFVVDIPQALLVGPKQDVEVEGDLLTGIRVSQFQPQPSPVVRLVLDLSRATEIKVSGVDVGLSIDVSNKNIDLSMASNRGSSTPKFNPQVPVNNDPGKAGTICIDAGHGGSDVGAQNHALGINEADVTLDIAKRLQADLRSQGWNVIMTRTTDKDVSYWNSSAREELGARAKVANDAHVDVFVSIHCNASVSQNSNGTSIHYYKQADYELARELQSGVMSSTGRTSRGLQPNRFYVLAHSEMPSVLIETAFITNPTEGALLADPGYRQRIADGISQGLRQYASKNLNWAAASK